MPPTYRELKEYEALINPYCNKSTCKAQNFQLNLSINNKQEQIENLCSIVEKLMIEKNQLSQEIQKLKSYIKTYVQ